MRFFVLFLFAGGMLHAQTNAAPPANDERKNPLISFLTPAEQDEYAIAHEKALANNPTLKSDGEKIMLQGAALHADSPAADKQAFIEKMNSHRQKLRQAMLKEDPKLQPIFTQIDKHLSEMKAKQLGHVQGSSAPSAGNH